MSFYAVAAGRVPGIYLNWSEAEMHVRGFSGAVYQKFSRRDLAEQFIAKYNFASLSPVFSAPSSTLFSSSSSSFSFSTSVQSSTPMLSSSSFSFSTPVPSSTPTKFERDSVFTDGSFTGGLAGYGWVFIPKNSDVHTLVGYGPVQGKLTNNTGELTAILRALDSISVRPLDIYTDSKYSMKCFTEWYSTWSRNGFRTSKGTHVANVELIQAIHARLQNISFHHVRAHMGHKWNEMADQLANTGRLADSEQRVTITK